jgi:hypothetical protein
VARQKRLEGNERSLYSPKHDQEPRCCFSIAPGELSLFIPGDEQSVPEGPGWESIAPTILRMLHFETPCQGRAVYHSQPAFAKSTGLFSQRTQCMPVSTTTPCLTVSAFNGKRGTKSIGRGSWRCKNQAHRLPRSQLGRIHVRACVEVRRTPKTRGRSCVVWEDCSCEGAWGKLAVTGVVEAVFCCLE